MINIKWRKAFTLAEVIIVCSLFALIVIWIIAAINRAFIFMDNTRLSVRATNLSREWVEMMYNLRDSNRRKYSWEKDKNWLNLWTWTSNMAVWIYTINEAVNTNGDYYIYLSWLNVSHPDSFYSLEWFFSGNFSTLRNATKLNFTGTYSYYSWWTLATWWILKDLVEVDGLDFYRIVRIYWIDNKYSPCTTDCPKELRFCVKVFYEKQWQHASELCSIMTNFME